MRLLCKNLAFSLLAGAALLPRAGAVSLDLGADYRVRTISAGNKLPSEPSLSFYTQRLQLYMETKLSRNVEAKLKVQSINPWGLEGSTNTSLQNTRYPSANGTPWVQTAFVRVPNLLNQPIQLTIGRQPITWGDGFVLTDDELGFNAIRVQATSPWPAVPLDTDIFYAKISEGLIGPARDFGLLGALLGTGPEKLRRIEVYWLEESNGSGSPYQAGAETAPVRASQITRQLLGVRVKGMIKDAYYKLEYAKQVGFVDRSGLGSGDLTLQGSGFLSEVGGSIDSKKLGRINAFVDFAFGSGDSPGDGKKDGAFRPTFAHRWDGLERSGYGRYFAATVSDVFSTSAIFSNSSSAQTGLPAGTSGVQIAGGGVGISPISPLKGTVAFFNYKAKESLTGGTSLGNETDLEINYQYNGFLSFSGVYARFTPGDAFTTNNQTATLTEMEAQLHF